MSNITLLADGYHDCEQGDDWRSEDVTFSGLKRGVSGGFFL
jgi:hypothetical protein